MLEKPDLADDVIISYLQDNFDLIISELSFLPIGYDATAWVYRVDCADTAYFLKVKKGVIDPAALVVPRYLRDQGIRQIVAPLSARSGMTSAPLDDFTLILYPFIEGQTGMDVGLSAAQWQEFGAILKHMHSLDITAELCATVTTETFRPARAYTIRQLDGHITDKKFANAHQHALAHIWRDKRDEILRILQRTEELGDKLKKSALAPVLCHCDIHTANLLITPQDELFIVDWDQPLLAPKERDLMFVTDGIAPQRAEEKHFFEGYGKIEVNPIALAYYRYEWVVQEIGDFGERVFFAGDVGDETRADSLRGFAQLFDEGDVVDAAYTADQSI